MTGAPVPAGADAVVPVERTETSGSRLLVVDSVPARKHIGPRGEDIRIGDAVLKPGRRLRAQDIGVLSSIGVKSASVVRRPRVRIVVTGNELLPGGSTPINFQITDANGPMLDALVNRDGGRVVDRRIIPDHPDAILAAMRDDVDVVLVSGGSSVGIEDYAPDLLSRHGRLVFHGRRHAAQQSIGDGDVGASNRLFIARQPRFVSLFVRLLRRPGHSHAWRTSSCVALSG